MRTENRPSHASQEMRPRVWILPNKNPRIAAIATHTAVQVAWLETEFKPMERPSIPDPATKVHPGWKQSAHG